ncbi:MAG: hypothetical protein KAI79_11905 [Bacteroidales bacterium]|nr:hypothetical protein [Bacteroidales bacterium]
MYKVFYKFLEDNEARDNFDKEFEKTKALLPYEKLMDGWRPLFFLSTPFVWCDSEQGEEYWHHLNDKWQEICRGESDD